MQAIFVSIFFVFLSLSPSCQSDEKASISYSASPTDTLPYYLAEPSHTIFFANAELKEISGLSPTEKPGVFLAVQDEKGIIFFVDASGGGKVLQQIAFKDKGDFEGVEMVDKSIFAAKSNGDIYEIKNWKTDGSQPEVEKFDTPLSKPDNVEGLCFDPRRNALLLACKGNADSVAIRNIYAFDLKTKTLNDKPLYSIDPMQVEQLLGSDASSGGGKNGLFAPSGIAIHPKTGDVYVISSVKKRLIVLDYSTGKIKNAVQLSKKILPQPEGIAFDPDGNLYLSSEGKNGEGLLLRFNRKI